MYNLHQEPCPIGIAFQLEYMLDSDEDIILVIKQKRIFKIQPEYLVATKKRLVFCVPNADGDDLCLHEYIWEYISKCKIINKTTFSILSIKLISGVEITTKYLSKKRAVILNNYINSMIVVK